MVPEPGGVHSPNRAQSRATVWAKAASRAYVMTAAAGTAVSILNGRRAEVLGIRTPFPVTVDVAVGLGAALAAPWPMIAALVRSRAAMDRTGEEGRKAKARLVVLSALFLAGAAGEPISHDLVARRLCRVESVFATTNLVLPLVMLSASVKALLEPVESHLRNARRTPSR